MLVGERIKLTRESVNLTQKVFSKSIGISQGHLSEMETNQRQPNEPILIAIEYTYRIKKEWLLTGEGPKYVSEREHVIGEPAAYYQANPEKGHAFDDTLVRQKQIFDMIALAEKKYDLKLGSFVVSLLAEIVLEYNMKENDLYRLFFMMQLFAEDKKKGDGNED